VLLVMRPAVVGRYGGGRGRGRGGGGGGGGRCILGDWLRDLWGIGFVVWGSWLFIGRADQERCLDTWIYGARCRLQSRWI